MGYRVISRVIAFALIAESLFGALYVTTLLSSLQGYDAVAVALIVARGLLGALQFVAGWTLANRRPVAVVLARWALAGGVILTVLMVGFYLAPTDIYHWYRWQWTAGYCIYATLGIAVIRRAYRSI